MGAYKYTCEHDWDYQGTMFNSDKVSRCKKCDITMITQSEDEFEKYMRENGYVYCDGHEMPNMFINTEWEV